MELHAKEGEAVCASCGLVQNRASLCVTPVASEQAAPPVSDKATRDLRGVPRGVLDRSKSYVVTEEAERTGKLWDELEHWNALAEPSHRLGLDALRVVDGWLGAWRDARADGHTDAARVAAALLFERVRTSAIPGEASVRAMLERCTPIHSGGFRRNGKLGALAKAHAETRSRGGAPAFACPTCGCRRGSMREAKVHCAKRLDERHPLRRRVAPRS